MNFLSGWRSYILAIGGIVTAIGGFLTGAMDMTQLIQAIFAALGLITLRHGITTTVSDATHKKL